MARPAIPTDITADTGTKCGTSSAPPETTPGIRYVGDLPAFSELLVRFLPAAGRGRGRGRNAVSGGARLPLVRSVTFDLESVLITGPQRPGGCISPPAGRENSAAGAARRGGAGRTGRPPARPPDRPAGRCSGFSRTAPPSIQQPSDGIPIADNAMDKNCRTDRYGHTIHNKIFSIPVKTLCMH